VSELDELAESARNRGLKLVRSRVRTPTKRRFGKAGLTDAKGKPVFGMDAKGPTAKPEEVEEYLRNLGAQDWGASLDIKVAPRKKKKAKRAEKEPPPPPKPKPAVREARPADAPRLVELIHKLAAEVDVKSAIDEKIVRKNLAALKKAGELPLVATLGKDVVGLIGRHRMVSVHRASPLGRIPVLMVAKDAQGQGVGKMLVEAVEDWCRKSGCEFIEVTSNDQLGAAHEFYQHLGFKRTSARFIKTL
jgi:GNAT superfamily N-acetyltransferase